MSDNQYTSQVAQIIDAISQTLSKTSPPIVYFIVTVGSLLSVVYFCFHKTDLALASIDRQLSVTNVRLAEIHESIVKIGKD